MFYLCETSQQLLEFLFDCKIKENPSFSANAFSKKIGISQSYFSLMLNGKRKITINNAINIAKKLQLPKAQIEYFLLLIKRENAIDEKDKNFYQQCIIAIRKQNDIEELDLDRFQLISDWHYSALLECLNLTDIIHSEEEYAKILKISVSRVEDSLSRLQRLNLIEYKNNRFLRTHTGFLNTPNGYANVGLKKFHKQIFRMAISAIDQQDISKRNFSGITMSIDPSKIPEAEKKIENFTQDLMHFLESGERKEVYQLSVLLFQLKNAGVDYVE